MSVVDDLYILLSENVLDTPANGGRSSNIILTDSSVSKVAVQTSNLILGGIRRRKYFVRYSTPDTSVLSDLSFFLLPYKTRQDSNDYWRYTPGGRSEIEADAVFDRYYGPAKIISDIAAGSNNISAEMEVDVDTIGEIFKVGDTVIVGAAAEDSIEIDRKIITSVSYNGSQIQVEVDNPLEKDVPAGYFIISAPQPEDLVASLDSVQVASTDGTFDSSQILLKNASAEEDNITITFISDTEFDVVSQYDGALGSGSINSDFAPFNPRRGDIYFSIPVAAWGGSFVSGDVVTFATHSAETSMWLEMIFPPGTILDQASVYDLEVMF